MPSTVTAGNERRPEDVPPEHSEARQPLRACHVDVIGLERLDHARAERPDHERREPEGDRGRRQEQRTQVLEERASIAADREYRNPDAEDEEEDDPHPVGRQAEAADHEPTDEVVRRAVAVGRGERAERDGNEKRKHHDVEDEEQLRPQPLDDEDQRRLAVEVGIAEIAMEELREEDAVLDEDRLIEAPDGAELRNAFGRGVNVEGDDRRIARHDAHEDEHHQADPNEHGDHLKDAKGHEPQHGQPCRRPMARAGPAIISSAQSRATGRASGPRIAGRQGVLYTFSR